MKIEDIKTMLSAIDKCMSELLQKSKYKENQDIANCVLALSAIIADIMKI